MQVSKQVTDTVQTIKLSGKRLLQLINDLLDAAHLRKAPLLVRCGPAAAENFLCCLLCHKQPHGNATKSARWGDALRACRHEGVELSAIIDDVAEQAMPSLQDGVQLCKRVYLVPRIIGDAARITQILYNVVSNACTFTRSGYVRIGAGYDSARDVVFLYVLDTGCGMAGEQLAAAFGEAVGTAENGRGGIGGGLGLHLVKALVAAHRCACASLRCALAKRTKGLVRARARLQGHGEREQRARQGNACRGAAAGCAVGRAGRGGAGPHRGVSRGQQSQGAHWGRPGRGQGHRLHLSRGRRCAQALPAAARRQRDHRRRRHGAPLVYVAPERSGSSSHRRTGARLFCAPCRQSRATRTR